MRALHRDAAQYRRMHQLVDDSELQRLPGANVLPGEDHVEPVREPDLARKPLRSPGPGNQSKLHFGKSEDRLRMIGRNAVPARQCGLEASAEARAVDRGDDRNPQPLERIEQHLAVATQPLRIGCSS